MLILNKKKKILIVLAIIAIIVLAFLGGHAYAKYFTKIKGTGLAEIATWSFKVNGEMEQIQTINLASTIDNETLVDNKIAPGTKGNFNIVIDATDSDVGINYNISFSDESNKPTNLKFIYNEQEYQSIEELADNLSGIINANDEEKTRTLNIGWEWKYETGSDANTIAQNDIIDTENGTSLANYTFNIIVSGTQVEPN